MRWAVKTRPSLASPRLPAPATVRELEGRAGTVSFVMVRPDLCEVAKELYWGHGRRPRSEDAFAVDLFAELAKKSDVILDVGAYTGLFTVVAARTKPDADIHAFEVIPDVYKLLFDNCVRNNVLKDVTIHYQGVGHSGQTVRFPARSSGSSLPSFYSADMKFSEGVDIRFIALDELSGSYPAGAVGLMKIDVEGTEADIFEHGREFMGKLRPDIICEVLPHSTSAATIMDVLGPLGYSYYLIGESGLTRREQIVPDDRYRDWFFSTRDEQELRKLTR